MLTSSSASGYGSGLISTPYTTLKIAVVAPIPSASVNTAAAVKPGWRRRPRTAWRKPEELNRAIVLMRCTLSAAAPGGGVPIGQSAVARSAL